MHILSIDDDAVFANALSEMLESKIFRLTRPNAEEATMNWPIFTIITPLF